MGYACGGRKARLDEDRRPKEFVKVDGDRFDLGADQNEPGPSPRLSGLAWTCLADEYYPASTAGHVLYNVYVCLLPQNPRRF